LTAAAIAIGGRRLVFGLAAVAFCSPVQIGLSKFIGDLPKKPKLFGWLGDRRENSGGCVRLSSIGGVISGCATNQICFRQITVLPFLVGASFLMALHK
jgi:hypothetical protein